uniref:Uncharacterized protein n=1 Tax=Setaria italica TaxID=4555 RepID=K3ZYP5_SETIT
MMKSPFSSLLHCSTNSCGVQLQKMWTIAAKALLVFYRQLCGRLSQRKTKTIHHDRRRGALHYITPLSQFLTHYTIL